MKTQRVAYKDGSVECEGFAAWPDGARGAKKPCVLVSHAWGGEDEFAREKAQMLAKLGYVGFAIDVYGKGKRGTTNDVNAKLMQPFLDDRAMLLKRMTAAVETARKLEGVDGNRLGAIGFCFGGLCVLDLARGGVAGIMGVVSFHGLLGHPTNLSTSKQTISAKVLALHGYDDPMATPQSVLDFAKEMSSAKADWRMLMFGNQVHAFTNPQANDLAHGMAYDAATTKRAFEAMEAFFKELFA